MTDGANLALDDFVDRFRKDFGERTYIKRQLIRPEPRFISDSKNSYYFCNLLS
jgi:hypothetical protein